jgi:chromosome segregation ATPase
MSLHQRVTKAELLTAAQRGRTAAADLDARLNDIRSRQQLLRDQLGEVTEARRATAPVFDELRERQIQLDRMLHHIESDADAGGRTLAERLRMLTEDVTHAQARLKMLEDSLATMRGFRDELANVKARMSPLQAEDDGVWALLADLKVRHGELVTALDQIERRNGESLSAHVVALTRSKNETEQRVAELFGNASVIESIRKAFDELAERRARLDLALSEVEIDAEGKSLVERQNELNEFTNQARGRLGTLEHTLALLHRFKEQLEEYLRGLAPLQSPVSGIEAAIHALRELLSRLHNSLDELERHDNEQLSARVAMIHRSKVETEQRIADAVDHFDKLAAVRKDVDGLMTKLRITVERLR